LGPVRTLDVRLRLDDRHHAMREHLPGDLELLSDADGDARRVRLVDYRTLFGAEHAQTLRSLEQLIEAGIRLHQLDSVLLRLEALVDLDEGNDAAVDQRLRGRLAVDGAVHRPLEQDCAQDLAVREAGRGDDPSAHLVDEVEHLLVAGPGALLDAVTRQRLGRGAARLVECGNEAVALPDLRFHLRLIHHSPFLLAFWNRSPRWPLQFQIIALRIRKIDRRA